MGVYDFLGDLAGSFLGGDDRDKADAERQKALDEMLGISAPSGNPYLQGKSEFGGIKLDPTTRAAQMTALQQMIDEGNQGGMSTADRVAQEQAMSSAAQADRGARGAIMQNEAARGMSGSGNQLAALLSGQQGAAEQQHQAAQSAAAAAQSRRLQSYLNAGQLGGQMHGQDYEEAAQRAAAQDQINRFNTQNQNQGVQQRFEDQMQRAGAVYGARQDRANQYQQKGDRWRQLGKEGGGAWDQGLAQAGQAFTGTGGFGGAFGGGGASGQSKGVVGPQQTNGYAYGQTPSDVGYGGQVSGTFGGAQKRWNANTGQWE